MRLTAKPALLLFAALAVYTFFIVRYALTFHCACYASDVAALTRLNGPTYEPLTLRDWKQRAVVLARYDEQHGDSLEQYAPTELKGQLTNVDVYELHHSIYGAPWAAGRDAFAALRPVLRANDVVLDSGCGSLRVGVWLIGQLKAGHYYGYDTDAKSVRAGVHYEVPLHGLRDKEPTVIVADTEEALAQFAPRKFDLMFSFKVFMHFHRRYDNVTGRAQVRRISNALAKGGRLLTDLPPFKFKVMDEELDLVVTRVLRQPSWWHTNHSVDLFVFERRGDGAKSPERFTDDEVHLMRKLDRLVRLK